MSKNPTQMSKKPSRAHILPALHLGCAGGSREQVIHLTQKTHSVTVRPGECFVVSLAVHAGIPYQWEATPVPNTLVHIIDQGFKLLDTRPGLCGGPAASIWRLQAQSSGLCKTHFQLVSLSSDRPPVDHVTLHVTIV